MSANEMTTKIEALRDLEELIEEAKAEAETLRDEIKAEMMARNVEELSVGQFIVRFTSILSNRFDTTFTICYTVTAEDIPLMRPPRQ